MGEPRLGAIIDLDRDGEGGGEQVLEEAHRAEPPPPAWRATVRCVPGYSKNRVDNAGRFIAEQLRAAVEDSSRVEEHRAELEEAAEVVDWWRAQHVEPLSIVTANLFRYVDAEGAPVIAQRLKRVPTIAAKLLREKGMKLSRMEDVGGVRAVLPTQDAAYRVARSLRRNWTITRFRDYVVDPKADGYRALHLVNRNRGRLVEVQLRTSWQDLWANAVEGAEQRFPGIKTGGGPPPLREFFIATAEVFATLDGTAEMPSVSRMLEIEDLIAKVDTYHGEPE